MSGSLRLQNPLHRDLAVFAVLLVVTAVVVELFVQQVLLPTLAADGLVHALAEEAASLFGSDTALQAGIVGFWVGLVVLWAADTYKRPLAIFPFLFGPIWASAVGVSVDSLPTLAQLEHLGIAVIFLLATVQVGGIGVVQYLRGGRLLAGPPNEPVELRNGPRLLGLTVSAFVALVVVDHHLTLTMAGAATANATFWNATYAVAIVALLYPFVRYDNRRRIVQIGPGRSGKTSTVGGMYCDIKEGSGAPGEDRTGRQLVTEQLRGISDRLTNSRSFPDKTDERGEIPFDYFDSSRLFRRKNVIMTFDYEGQQLTGENGPTESFSAKLRTYRDRKQEAGVLSRLRSRLARVLGLDTGPWYREFTSGPGEPDIAKLLDSANTVLFTLPLDDFLTPSFERGGNIPDNAGIYLVEPTEDDDERYLVRRPWGEEFELYRSADGELRRASDDETVEGLDFDSFDELPLAPGGPTGERRYTTDKDRAPPTSYLDEYRRLIDLLWESDSRGGFDGSCEFVWVATMSDLVYDDYTDLYGELTARSTEPKEATGTLQFLWDNGLFDTTGEPERSRQDYTLFGQWIVDQCIQRHILRSRESSRRADGEAIPDVDELIGRTGEQSVYPVWFDVAHDEQNKLVIEDGSGRLLKGSNFLFERIEGRTLPYPTFPRFKSPKLRVAYQWMNPFTDPTGKPFYASAVEELERCANYRRPSSGDGDSSTD